MSARNLLAMIAFGRLIIGVAMILVPKEVATRWLGRGAGTPESGAFIQAVGGRDVAYALGSLHAVRSGGDPKPWLAAGLLVDGTDSVATMTADGVPLKTRVMGGWAAFAATAANAYGVLAADED